jgi:phosphopantetheinyl transferase
MLCPSKIIHGVKPPETGAEGVWFWHTSPLAAGAEVLSEPENARVSRHLFPEKRDLLAASLAERRRLLAELLGCEPAGLQIAHDDQGKPGLPDYPDISISFSDSEGWNGLALSRDRPVGIDVELVRPVSWEPMLNMLAEDNEADDIRAVLADLAGLDPFFRCWTAKEAILKAAGTGLKGGARRIRLPSAFIAGDTDHFIIVHDELNLAVETFLEDRLVLSRALAA